MRRAALVATFTGLAGLAGCHGPYRPTSFPGGPDVPPLSYGMPITEGPMLSNGNAFPYPPGSVVVPGPGVQPGMTPAAPPPVMPPATGAAPPLNSPPTTGPMPRIAPSPASNPGKS